MDILQPMLIDACRKTLNEYHADALSVIHKHGVKGSNYSQVWLEINRRLTSELDAKGKTDGALYAVGEFLERIESTQCSLDSGRIEEALLSALAMVREAHQMRGKMILKETTSEKVAANEKSVKARKAAAEKKKAQVQKFRATNDQLRKNECWEKWERLHPRSGINRTQFFKYLLGIT